MTAQRNSQVDELIVVGLGANIGCEQTMVARFCSVARLLRSCGAFAVRAAHVYRSVAVGPVRDQPDFLNTALSFRLVDINAHAFLPVLWSFENALGRVRPAQPKKGPRRIDIDVLHWLGRRYDGQLLTVPHPRIEERAFARRPLAELLSSDLEEDNDSCRRAVPPTWLTEGTRPAARPA